MKSKQCAGCGEAFHPRPQTPKQAYCSAPVCQRERRRRWQQTRRQNDPEYKDNQSRAQASWAARHPDYWQEYRQTHPASRDRNRTLQRERDHRRRARKLAKMDAWMVEITLISMQCAPTG